MMHVRTLTRVAGFAIWFVVSVLLAVVCALILLLTELEPSFWTVGGIVIGWWLWWQWFLRLRAMPRAPH